MTQAYWLGRDYPLLCQPRWFVVDRAYVHGVDWYRGNHFSDVASFGNVGCAFRGRAALSMLVGVVYLDYGSVNIDLAMSQEIFA